MRNRLSYLLLVAGCLAAAAGGGYLAVRQSVPASATGTVQVPSQGSTAAPAASPAARTAPTDPSGSQPEAAATSGANVDLPSEANEPAAPSRDVEKHVRQSAARPSRPAADSSHTTHATAARPVKKTARAERSTPAPLASAEWQAVEQQLPDGDPAPDPALQNQAPPLEQFVISPDSVIGLSLDTPVSSETARVEDSVQARITRDVKVGDKVAIPAGTIVRGTVTDVERGGKLKTRARLGLTFTTIMMPDGAEVPIETEAIFRDGASPGDAATKKIGASAVAGTILGAIFGGAKGALIGGATGAAGGTAVAEVGDRHPATFPTGATITVRLRRPVTVTVEQ
jgi:type IV secretory pathway VirB10-like protein